MSTLFFNYNDQRYNLFDIIKIGEIQKSTNYENTFFFTVKMTNITINITFSSDENIKNNTNFHEGAILTDNPQDRCEKARRAILASFEKLEEQTLYFSK